MFYIYFSAHFQMLNGMKLNGYIIFEHIIESIAHRSIHINTIIHSKRTSQAHGEQNFLFYKFKVYYLLLNYTKRFNKTANFQIPFLSLAWGEFNPFESSGLSSYK